ncbi:M17 family peptidase N-terminal domain-containing protein, partial [Klebsiella pneumoniae]
GKAAQEAESVVGQALLSRIIDVSDFKGKLAASLSTLAPGGTELDRLVLVGAGDPAKLKADDWLKLGGSAFSK